MPEQDNVLDFETLTGRKEEEAVFNDPVKVVIGGKPYPLTKHTIRQARDWRSRMITMMGTLQLKAEGEGGLETFAYINDQHLPAMAELVAEYSSSSGLTVEIIETQGTDDELVDAFMAVLRHCRIPLDRMKTA